MLGYENYKQLLFIEFNQSNSQKKRFEWIYCKIRTAFAKKTCFNKLNCKLMVQEILASLSCYQSASLDGTVEALVEVYTGNIAVLTSSKHHSPIET